ncbi:reactive intermediate/imine deaminase family protein, partial [Vibrio parahaemolyticus V-223/04]
TWF